MKTFIIYYQQDKQLVYAELVLKPANEKAAAATPAKTTAATVPIPEGSGVAANRSIEYAEIVYVQKGGEDKK